MKIYLFCSVLSQSKFDLNQSDEMSIRRMSLTVFHLDYYCFFKYYEISPNIFSSTVIKRIKALEKHLRKMSMRTKISLNRFFVFNPSFCTREGEVNKF